MLPQLHSTHQAAAPSYVRTTVPYLAIRTGMNGQVSSMRPLGYLYKRVANRPAWLKAETVEDIYSLSNCISKDFADYINYWKHNGYWLFDSPEAIQALAAEHSISLEGLKLFYYEAHEEEYDDERQAWVPFGPEPSFVTNVVPPKHKTVEGFDVTCYSAHTSPECSPLSCNACAEMITTNAHCLLRTFEEAVHAIESGQFKGTEPGPYRIIAVYSTY